MRWSTRYTILTSKPSLICIFGFSSILICSYLKGSWRFSEGIKEFHSKHFTMLTCLHAYLFFHGSNVYHANDSDIFVITFGRSGTMMTVNLLHQLRTGGHDKFDDITRVGHHFVPITGLGYEYLNNPQVGEPPRIFYSHGFPWQIPRAKQYIYVIRNPVDIAKSWFTFGKQFYQLRSDLEFEDFFYNCLLRNCFWPSDPLWNHIVSWWHLRTQSTDGDTADTAKILWLYFENFASNETTARRTIRKVANHLGKNVTPRLEGRVYHRISYNYFLKHQNKFDIHDIQEASGYIINECTNREDYMIDYDKIGVQSVSKTQKSVNVPRSILDVMHKKWTSIVFPKTGFKNYQKMLQLATM